MFTAATRVQHHTNPVLSYSLTLILFGYRYIANTTTHFICKKVSRVDTTQKHILAIVYKNFTFQMFSF